MCWKNKEGIDRKVISETEQTREYILQSRGVWSSIQLIFIEKL